jgi:hypothetical protein
LQKGLLVCVFAIVHFLLEPVRKAAFNHHLLLPTHMRQCQLPSSTSPQQEKLGGGFWL